MLGQIGSSEVAAILLAAGTFVGTLMAAIRSLRTDKATQAEKEDAALLAGYKELASELRADVARLRQEFDADRSRWATERDLLHMELRACRQRIAELERLNLS